MLKVKISTHLDCQVIMKLFAIIHDAAPPPRVLDFLDITQAHAAKFTQAQHEPAYQTDIMILDISL